MGKALPAHLNVSSCSNILSLSWVRQNLTQFDAVDGDEAELPFYGLGKESFVNFKITTTENFVCILGVPFTSANTPMVIESQSVYLMDCPSMEEAFLPFEIVPAFLKTQAPGLPCEQFCMEKYRATPGTYIPAGFPTSIPEGGRMKAGAWINDIFNGLPPKASHRLYAGRYTMQEIKKAYIRSLKTFSPATQCLCQLGKKFAENLPKQLKNPSPFYKLLKW